MGPWLVTRSGAEPGLAFQLLQVQLQRERRDRQRETEMERAGRGRSEKGGKEGGRERRTEGAPSLRTAGSGPARVLPSPT